MKSLSLLRKRPLIIATAVGLLLAGAGVVTVAHPARAKLFAQPMKLPDLADALADTYCDALKTCDGKSELDMRWSYGGFEKNCKQVWATRLKEETFAGMTQAVASGTLEYDGRGAAECLTNMKQLGCNMFDHSVFSVCTSVFQGKAKGQCKYSYECGEGMRCEIGGSCPGNCVSKSAATQPCRSSMDCQDGLFCSERSQICVALKSSGDSCDPADGEFQCTEGLTCAAGKCTPYEKLYVKNEGEECDETSRCKQPLVCALEKEKNACRQLSNAGAACTESFPSQCPAGHYCSANASRQQWEGKCEPSKTDGTACAADKECATGLACRGTKCRKLGVRGEKCSSDNDCVSGACERGSCAEKDICEKD